MTWTSLDLEAEMQLVLSPRHILDLDFYICVEGGMSVGQENRKGKKEVLREGWRGVKTWGNWVQVSLLWMGIVKEGGGEG